MQVSLKAARDLLLPGLWMASGRENSTQLWDFDISDGENLQMVSEKTRVVLLTRNEIEDGTYRTVFTPRVKQVMRTGEWH